MQSKNIKRIIIHDILYGFRFNTTKFIFVLLFFLYLCSTFFISINQFRGTGIIENNPSIVDCWIFIFRGMAVYIPSNGMPFQIPIYWLMQQLLLAFLLLNYPTQDVSNYGVQILTRARNKSIWWLSKSIWSVCTVVSFYLIAFIIIAIYSVCFGEVSFQPHLLINSEINQVNINGIQDLYFYIAIFLVPIVASISLAMLQMSLSFILSPILSYLILVCYMVISAYYCSPFFIGNFTMILRNAAFEQNGSNNVLAIIVSAILFIIAFTVGYVYFKMSDVLEKR